MVACFSAPGALVCDPFVGSGTSAVACAQLGRAFVGGDAGQSSDGRPWAEIARVSVERDGAPRPMTPGEPEQEAEAAEDLAA